MKLSALLFVITAALMAQPSTVSVQDTVYDQFGQLYNGTVTISLSIPGASSAAHPVLSLVTRLSIRNGVLSVNLQPNDQITWDGTNYGTRYQLVYGNSARKTCFFPTSATPLSLKPYCSDGAPSAVVALNQDRLGNGVQCVQLTNGVMTRSNACSGGGGGLRLLTLSNSQLSSLSNSQLSSLVN